MREYLMEKRYEFNLTPAYCLYNGVAVLEQNGASIRFLIENKKDELLCGRLSRAFEAHVASIRRLKDCPEAFQRLINIHFEKGNRGQLRKCISKLYMADGVRSGLAKGGDNSDVAGRDLKSREAAAVLLLDSILTEARTRKATDIHIEKNCVRLRIDGRLEKLLELQAEKAAELVQRIKLLAGMNVIENRRCQDGHFVYGNKNPFFLRVSTMAIVGGDFEEHSDAAVFDESNSASMAEVDSSGSIWRAGKKSGTESVVIRLLDTSRIPLSLGQLGYNKNQLEKLCDLINMGFAMHQPSINTVHKSAGKSLFANGLILVCGPTGSGKSTSIAAMLVEIEKRNPDALKIISLEDPPEYIIPGITQVKVDEKNVFSEALNHIFRQDPDVIMIGEIRDEESAGAALRASLTGHLVFATLHAGSAVEAILRLENLGVDRNCLVQVLRGIICQELNMLNGKLRLYADFSVPKEKFSELASKVKNDSQLENLMEHYTNYSEVLSETMQALKDQKSGIKNENISSERNRLITPLYKRRNEDAEIHKGAV